MAELEEIFQSFVGVWRDVGVEGFCGGLGGGGQYW